MPIACVLLTAFILATLTVCGNGQAQTTADPLERVAIIGDSMSTGYGVMPGNGYHQLLGSDFNNRGWDVETFAVNGATPLRHQVCPATPEVKGCSEEGRASEYIGLPDHLREYQPTTVLVVLGGNDLLINRPANTYADDMRDLSDDIRVLAPDARIIFVLYYDVTQFNVPRYEPGTVCDIAGQCDSYQELASWAAYRTELKERAAYIDVPVIDLSGAGFNRSHVGEDLVHLNVAGHDFFYRTLSANLR
ncbi:MAG: SGNH/GDSL hydrolase family protein [Candidatus Binatia bacterium]